MRLEHRRRLLRLMVLHRVSGRAVARAAGYASHTYMQRLIRGEARTVDPKAAQRIAEFFDIAIGDLFVPDVSDELDGSCGTSHDGGVQTAGRSVRSGGAK